MSCGPEPPSPPRSPRRIEIVPVDPLDEGKELLGWLAAALGKRFEVPVVRGEHLEPAGEWWDPERGQLNSNRIVDVLIARDGEPPAPPERWILGITSADLFAPDRSFVFGEAALGGAWAVISLARLRPRTPSRDPETLLRRRILKEAVHELGHLAGLGHCDRPRCVMYPSETLEDTDRKSSSRCPACEEGLRGPSGLDRSSSSG